MVRAAKIASLVGVATAVALTGCGSKSGPSAAQRADMARADASAMAFRADLRRYAQRLRATPIRLTDGKAQPLPAEPRLAPVDGDSAAYRAARRLADRMDAVHDELVLVNRASSRSTARLAVAAGEINDAMYETHVRLSTAAYSRGADLIIERYRAFVGADAGYERRFNRTYDRYLGRVAAATRLANGRLGRLHGRDELQRSALAFQRAGYAEWLRRIARVRDRIDAAPSVGTSDVGYREAASSDLYGNAVTAAGNQRAALMRGFRRVVDRLAASDGRGPLPSAADPYRDVITHGLVRPREPRQAVRPDVEVRLWMLYRVRELDRVPKARYDAAVQTLLLYDVGNVSAAVQPFLTGIAALRGELDAPSDEDGRAVKTVVRYMQDAVDDPVAPLQVSARAAVLTEVAKLDPEALARNERFDERRRATKPLVRAIRRMTRVADDPAAVRRALDAAVAATRPRPR